MTNTDITTPMPSAPPLLMYIFRPVAKDVVHEEGDERTDRGESRHAERRAVSLEAFRSLLIALGAVARGARLHCCFRRTIAACLRWSPSGFLLFLLLLLFLLAPQTLRPHLLLLV